MASSQTPPVRKSFVVGVLLLAVLILAGGWLISSLQPDLEQASEDARRTQTAVDGSIRKMRELSFQLGKAGIKAPFGPISPEAALSNNRVQNAFARARISTNSFELQNNQFDKLLASPPTLEIIRSTADVVVVTYRFDQIDDESCVAVLHLSPSLAEFSSPAFSRQDRADFGLNLGRYLQRCQGRGHQRMEMTETLRLRKF